jgi:hypothetical protein
MLWQAFGRSFEPVAPDLDECIALLSPTEDQAQTDQRTPSTMYRAIPSND